MDDTTSTAAEAVRHAIDRGETALGIEFGSTRIKAVLVGADARPLASGSHDWENGLVDGLWSYDEDMVWEGLRAAYRDLADDVERTHGTTLRTVGSMGVSAMMHGYLALGADGGLLVPFRTWRNTSTGPAARELSELFRFNIPLRWSIAHLHQAVLDGEEHLRDLASLTTLAGLVHERLSGRHVLGVGDASGMFPIDPQTCDYDRARLDAYDEVLAGHGLDLRLRDLLPEVLVAGEDAGVLTEEGARLLDPSGTLGAGVAMCPPEGDAGTGMVATHAVGPRTGNVSAGTSVFAMVVLERELRDVHPELDVVTTPEGFPVAMVHSNNGTSEWDQWVGVFSRFARAAGLDLPRHTVHDLLYAEALEGPPDGGGLLAYNFLSGEPIVGLDRGRPLSIRSPHGPLSLASFTRTQLMTVFGSLRLGMDILLEDEGVRLDGLHAHGGLFKTPVVAQKVMAGALRTPVTVGTGAGEGGPWGMALLALYRAQRKEWGSLSEFLDRAVFAGTGTTTIEPDPEDVAGFEAFMERYRAGLPVARAAGALDD
ncbi:xylulokinase [Actinomyces polynesiensis]|uniref:xylulokinase n=1 Tax=Actinomyces polynesiensis TaxID=1325934 RepID=UPI0005BA47B1|nr:FGGY-family carbohydrate kinase [Actinomyces polynesiensis]